jgi:hypothetical protein
VNTTQKIDLVKLFVNHPTLVKKMQEKPIKGGKQDTQAGKKHRGGTSQEKYHISSQREFRLANRAHVATSAV